MSNSTSRTREILAESTRTVHDVVGILLVAGWLVVQCVFVLARAAVLCWCDRCRDRVRQGLRGEGCRQW